MFDKTLQSLQDFYRLFTSDLTRAEIERLVKVDARGMYAYYMRSMEQPAAKVTRWKRLLIFARNLFVAFLLKLPPARRLLYAIAFMLFALALINRNWWNVVYAFLILNFLLALELTDKLMTRDELTVAREIQLSLLPTQATSLPGFEFATFSDAAKSVGGDYYDFIPLSDGSMLVVIGDVSGKGISAALYMVQVQTMLRLFVKDSAAPRDLLNHLNSQLHRVLRRNYFLTVALARLYPNGEMELCRAGHTPALIYDNAEKFCLWLEPKGIAIGLENGQNFSSKLESAKRLMKSGDLLLLFTDGVVETANGQLMEFGENRLAQILARNYQASPESIKAMLVHELASFRSGAELRDDTTFVVIKRCVP
ncbi:MAG: PP2C family protein-serine/threonine phosphatase [candidate division KSB1 bacterium]|nr:PP2C family protein-serine/threonine phosphatase [candidate division KSB1 bacterium]MDZ7304115.1 PP2C family protein-serine/threonine phosphatase [candidate division KSB1 bacterium]MDZ7313388.1 PP2C family protein-serine/threonine phosphatase [candidate division KSB1 bacterium]